jgi:hypothetical protein
MCGMGKKYLQHEVGLETWGSGEDKLIINMYYRSVDRLPSLDEYYLADECNW